MDALFHVEFDIIQRSKNQNSLKLLAYQRCAKIGDFNFSKKKQEHRGSLLLLPEGAPDWANDPVEIFRRAEQVERRVDAQPARAIVFSIPRAVPTDQRAEFCSFVLKQFVDAGMAVVADLHCVEATDCEEQPHCHVLLTMRRFVGSEFDRKKERSWNDSFREHGGRVMRAKIAASMNEWLMANRVDATVHAETHAERGLPPPEPNISCAAVHVFKKAPDRAVIFPKILEQRAHRKNAKMGLRYIAALDREIDQVARKIEERREWKGTIGPASAVAREARRRRWIAATLAQKYELTWVNISETENLKRVYCAGDDLHILLKDGCRLIDHGDSIDVHGQSDTAVEEAVRAVERQRWTAVSLTGTTEFRVKVGLELLDRSPSVQVSGLTDAERLQVEQELDRRAASRQSAALAFTHAMRIELKARLQSAVTPDHRRYLTEAMDRLDAAQAAIQLRDREMTLAAYSGDARAIERLTQQRLAAAKPEVEIEMKLYLPRLGYWPKVNIKRLTSANG